MAKANKRTASVRSTKHWAGEEQAPSLRYDYSDKHYERRDGLEEQLGRMRREHTLNPYLEEVLLEQLVKAEPPMLMAARVLAMRALNIGDAMPMLRIFDAIGSSYDFDVAKARGQTEGSIIAVVERLFQQRHAKNKIQGYISGLSVALSRVQAYCRYYELDQDPEILRLAINSIDRSKYSAELKATAWACLALTTNDAHHWGDVWHYERETSRQPQAPVHEDEMYFAIARALLTHGKRDKAWGTIKKIRMEHRMDYAFRLYLDTGSQQQEDHDLAKAIAKDVVPSTRDGEEHLDEFIYGRANMVALARGMSAGHWHAVDGYLSCGMKKFPYYGAMGYALAYRVTGRPQFLTEARASEQQLRADAGEFCSDIDRERIAEANYRIIEAMCATGKHPFEELKPHVDATQQHHNDWGSRASLLMHCAFWLKWKKEQLPLDPLPKIESSEGSPK